MLESFFKLKEHGTDVKTEVIAGFTTFLTMAYIVIVNPAILSITGMDFNAVFVATCLAAALGTAIMALVANYPIALAPGMGLNAYFTFTVVKGMGVPWEAALGAVFISGIVFLAVSLFKVREAIVNAIPQSLKFAISAGPADHGQYARPESAAGHSGLLHHRGAGVPQGSRLHHHRRTGGDGTVHHAGPVQL